MAGIADSQAVRRNIPGDDAAGADHAVRPDRHARQDDDAGADPDIVADIHRVRVLQPGQALLHVHGVFLGDDADIRSDEYMAADGDLPAVHKLAVDIQEKMIADRGVVAVGAEQRLLHRAVLADLPEYIADRRLTRLAVERMNMIVLVQFLHGEIAVRAQLRIIGLVQQAGMRFFFLRHHLLPFLISFNCMVTNIAFA